MKSSEFNELITGATKEELKELIISGINETIPMTNKQILKLVELKNNI